MGLGCGLGERPLEECLYEDHCTAAVGNRYANTGGALGNDPQCHHSEGHEQPRTVEGGGGSLGWRDLGMVGDDAEHPQPARSTSTNTLSPITTAVRCKHSGLFSSPPFLCSHPESSCKGEEAHPERIGRCQGVSIPLAVKALTWGPGKL